jgi:NADH-quinone oxidoreductase subunit J
MPDTIAFYIFSGLAIGTAALVIGQRNPMYSVMLLIASFASLSGLYVLLDAPFTAITQMIVYAGAIMVLFLFVVMLLNAPQEDGAEYDRVHPLRHPVVTRFGTLLATLLILQLSWVLMRMNDLHEPVGSRANGETVSSVRAIGRVLFDRHAFAFEATSILILVAMIGAVVLARKEGEQR